MDKQEVQNAVAEFFISERGRALVAESLSAHIDRNDAILLNPESRLSESGPEVLLTRKQIFERAMDLARQHGDEVDGWVRCIQRAIQAVNEAQPEPGRES